jgi:putative membrane protein
MAGQTAAIRTELDVSTKLAFDRTRLAYDRTMMSWVRTATSLITFGFTIYKFFQFEFAGRTQQVHLIGPRGFALILISIGLVSLLAATIQHRLDRNALRVLYPEVPRSPPALLAGLIALLGILALLAVVMRQ